MQIIKKSFFISVSSNNIEVVAGEQVYLPCDISTTDPDDQVALVLWYREDFGTPIYRYVKEIMV